MKFDAIQAQYSGKFALQRVSGGMPPARQNWQLMNHASQMSQTMPMQVQQFIGLLTQIFQAFQMMQGAKGEGLAGLGLGTAQQQQLPQLEGGAGKWLTGHGTYKKLGDGKYQINKGEYAGSVAQHQGNGKFIITDEHGSTTGTWDSPGGKEKIASPLTFDLNGDGKVSTTTAKDGKQIDIDGDGKVDQSAWAGKGDGVLAFDADGDGKVGTNGRELLGNNTDVDGDGKADGHQNGFEALKALAAKHLGQEAVADGKLDAQELKALDQKANLKMMVDGQQKSLEELGITNINLGYQEAGANADAQGNQHRQLGAGFTQAGEIRKVNDVWFKYE